MADIINYYEELKLDRSLSAAELTNVLNSMERAWQQREISVPEKAAEMLKIIRSAKQHLTTDDARAEYDKQLLGEEEPAQPAPPPAEIDPDALNAAPTAADRYQQEYTAQSDESKRRLQAEMEADHQAMMAAQAEEQEAELMMQSRQSAAEKEKQQIQDGKQIIKKRSRYAWLAYLGFGVLSTLLLAISWKAYPLLLFFPLYLAVTAGLLIFDKTGFSKVVSFLGSVVFALIGGSARYIQHGQNAVSAKGSWRFGGLTILLTIVLLVVCPKINQSIQKKLRGF